MASNAQKTHFALTQNRFAEQKALQAIEKLGKGLPCSVAAVAGSIVTVKFELNAAPFTLPKVTVPIATSHYFFQPIQIGDTGVVIPADVYLGGISELGGGTPDLTLPANLSALMFLPLARASWVPTDPNKAEIFGPAGTIIRDAASTAVVTWSENQIALVTAAFNLMTAMALTGAFTATDEITAKLGAMQVSLSTHTHQNSGGSGTGGPPTPGS